jgi:hypothetical protein
LGKVLLLLLSTAAVLGTAKKMLRLAGFPAPRLLTPDATRRYHMTPGAAFLYEGYLVGNDVDFTNMVYLNREG